MSANEWLYFTRKGNGTFCFQLSFSSFFIPSFNQKSNANQILFHRRRKSVADTRDAKLIIIQLKCQQTKKRKEFEKGRREHLLRKMLQNILAFYITFSFFSSLFLSFSSPFPPFYYYYSYQRRPTTTFSISVPPIHGCYSIFL